MISTKNTLFFKKSIETVSNLIPETNVRFKDSGIYIKAMDKTQILLIDFSMSKDCFDSYSIEPNLIGLNIQELFNMISRSFDKDKLRLDLKENYLDIFLKGEIERRFNLPFIDLSYDDINMPKQEYDTTINIKTNLLKEILKDINLIGTTLLFKVVDGKFIVESKGDKGKISVSIPHIKIKSKKDVTAKYSLSFLRNITKSMDNNLNLILKFSEDSLLYIEYNIDDKVSIKFYLSSMLI